MLITTVLMISLEYFMECLLHAVLQFLSQPGPALSQQSRLRRGPEARCEMLAAAFQLLVCLHPFVDVTPFALRRRVELPSHLVRVVH
jgi:hypothetical protein